MAISAGDWVRLLEVVAAGEVHLVLSTDSGARVAVLAERELVGLREAVAAVEAARVVLTAREREALLAVEEGLSTGQVAERLGIARGTAVQHLAAARRKFAVRTSAQAAARAREAGQLG